MMGGPVPIAIAAGGTGGHIYPALAVAQQLRQRGSAVHWVGTQQGHEARVAADNGFEFAGITVDLRRRNSLLGILRLPLALLQAVLQAWRALGKIKPGCLLGMGGFSAVAWGIAALLRRCPVIVHEQNTVVGRTNQLLAPWAKLRLEGMAGSFNLSERVICTGNPVRSEIAAMAADIEKQESTRRRVLILGGSQGAHPLNQLVPPALSVVARTQPLEIVHQCGQADRQMVADRYRNLGLEARVEIFIEEIAQAYGWATLIISRAGAMTLAEIALAAVPSVLIPFPHAARDHQYFNALQFERAGAALLLQQSELSSEILAAHCGELLADSERLQRMRLGAQGLAYPNAVTAVAEHCRSFCRDDE